MRFFKAFTAVALLVLLAVTPAFAQQPVSAAVSDDTGVAMLVRYVGSTTSATIAVAAGGDITVEVGGAAYTGFECPVSGALGGVIDVSNAACNTMGEVVDTLNGNCTGCSSDFRAVLVDSLRADSSNDTIVTFAAAEATRTDGLPLNIDTSTAFIASYALVPSRDDISIYLGGPPNYNLLENPFEGTFTSVQWAEAVSTYGSGTSNWYVYSVLPSNKTASSETSTTIWGPEAGGATTANKQLTYWQTNMLPGRFHEKVIVRLTNSAAMASTAGFVLGQKKPIP